MNWLMNFNVFYNYFELWISFNCIKQKKVKMNITIFRFTASSDKWIKLLISVKKIMFDQTTSLHFSFFKNVQKEFYDCYTDSWLSLRIKLKAIDKFLVSYLDPAFRLLLKWNLFRRCPNSNHGKWVKKVFYAALVSVTLYPPTSKGSRQKKTRYFMTSSQFHLLPTHHT